MYQLGYTVHGSFLDFWLLELKAEVAKEKCIDKFIHIRMGHC